MLFRSFSWCFLRLEGVIQPSESSSSDSVASTSSTRGSAGIVVSFPGSEGKGSWVSFVDMCVSSSFRSRESICSCSATGIFSGILVPHAPRVSGTTALTALFASNSLSSCTFGAVPSFKDAGGAPFTLFCPGTLRNLQSPWFLSHSSSYANAIRCISGLLRTSKSPVFRAKSVMIFMLAGLGDRSLRKGRSVCSTRALVASSRISSMTAGMV